MEPLDLLNILDIIRNEEQYAAKIQALYDAQKEYADAKVIAATVAEAQKYLDNAKLADQAIKDLRASAEKELAEYKEKKTAKLKEWEAKLLDKEDIIDAKAETARQVSISTKELQASLEKERKTLQEWDMKLIERQAVINAMEQIYMDKFRRIKAVIEE